MIGQLKDGETFEIPYKVNLIEVNICSFGKTYDSATFELRRDKTFSKDVIKIALYQGDRQGGEFYIETNCPEIWQRI